METYLSVVNELLKG